MRKPVLPQHASRHGGLTLPELLVVMAIIAILIALLWPSLTGVMETAHRTTCLNNQRTIMQACVTYTVDNNGLLPAPNWGPNSNGWLYNGQQHEGLKSAADAAANYPTGQIWPYIKEQRIYKCPLDKPTAQVYDQRLMQLSSYTMNGVVCGFGSVSSYRISQFPANGIALWEPSDDNNGFYFNDGGNYPSEYICQRHKGGAIVACFDGHAEFILWPTYQKLMNMSPGRLWCKPGSANGH